MRTCSKVSYASRTSALLAMRAIARRMEERGRTAPKGAYLCSTCRCWHLTSVPGVQTAPWSKR